PRQHPIHSDPPRCFLSDIINILIIFYFLSSFGSSPILSVKSGLAHAVAFSLCDRSARRWSACCSRLRVSRQFSNCFCSSSLKRTPRQRALARHSTAKTSLRHSFSVRKRGNTLARRRSSSKLRSTRLVVRMLRR